MRRILESKVNKVGSGFYGHFTKMRLFVFSKDNLGEADALKTMNYTIGLQKYLDNKYNRLYIADVDDLFVCNLDDGISPGSRLIRYHVTQEQRRTFLYGSNSPTKCHNLATILALCQNLSLLRNTLQPN